MKTITSFLLFLTISLPSYTQTMNNEDAVIESSKEYLKLSPRQVQNNRREVDRVLKQLNNVTQEKVISTIEKVSGLKVYRQYDFDDWTKVGNRRRYSNGITSHTDIMDLAIRYMVNAKTISLRFEPKNLPKNNIVIEKESQASIRPHTTSSKDKLFSDVATLKLKRNRRVSVPWDEFRKVKLGKKSQTYTTLKRPYFEIETQRLFLEAFVEHEIQALGATVVFLNGNLENGMAHQVYYPTFSRSFSVPEPIIFISKDAQFHHFEDLFNLHAARIHNYNKLYKEQVIPRMDEINKLVKKHGEEDQVLIEMIKDDRRKNAIEILKGSAQLAQQSIIQLFLDIASQPEKKNYNMKNFTSSLQRGNTTYYRIYIGTTLNNRPVYNRIRINQRAIVY